MDVSGCGITQLENNVSLWSVLGATLNDPWSLAAAASKFFIYVFSFLSVGLLLAKFALPTIDGTKESKGNGRIVVLVALIAIAATMVRVLVQAGRLMDDGFSGMLDLEIIAISLEGPLGQSSYVRITGLLLIILAACVPQIRFLATIAGAFLVTGSFALIGHAMHEPQVILSLLLIFHLLAVSYWWGALLPLHNISGKDADLRNAAGQAETFGRQASVIVPLLILAGGLFYFFLTGNLITLLTTHYGNMVLIKIGAVAIVLAFAALNKLRFVPALAANMPDAALNFRRSLKVEAVFFLCVFAATALLTTSFVVPIK